MKKNLFESKFSKGFTLIELLVAVLIIGILAAIAVVNYKKTIYKSRLFKGVSMVESLYQAQQAYYLAKGSFAKDIDLLDLSLPLNDSCVKTQNSSISRYKCDFGTIGIFDSKSNVQFQAKPAYNAYLHFFKDTTISGKSFRNGERWCFAHTKEKHPSRQICVDMGGEEVLTNNSWSYYRLK